MAVKVAIVYWTATGNTEAMAGEIALGARDAGAEVLLENVADVTVDAIKDYDRIVLGCPAMGIEELEEYEMTPFVNELLPFVKDKDMAIFGSCGWSKGEWLQKWAGTLHEAGANFLVAPLRCTGYPEEDALRECRELGNVMGKEYTA